MLTLCYNYFVGGLGSVGLFVAEVRHTARASVQLAHANRLTLDLCTYNQNIMQLTSPCAREGQSCGKQDGWTFGGLCTSRERGVGWRGLARGGIRRYIEIYSQPPLVLRAWSGTSSNSAITNRLKDLLGSIAVSFPPHTGPTLCELPRNVVADAFLARIAQLPTVPNVLFDVALETYLVETVQHSRPSVGDE